MTTLAVLGSRLHVLRRMAKLQPVQLGGQISPGTGLSRPQPRPLPYPGRRLFSLLPSPLPDRGLSRSLSLLLLLLQSDSGHAGGQLGVQRVERGGGGVDRHLGPEPHPVPAPALPARADQEAADVAARVTVALVANVSPQPSQPLPDPEERQVNELSIL